MKKAKVIRVRKWEKNQPDSKQKKKAQNFRYSQKKFAWEKNMTKKNKIN